MNDNDLEKLNKLASSLTIDQINNLTDNEILNMAMERPDHVGQFGFMLQVQFFNSEEHFAETMHALLERLGKVKDIKEKKISSEEDTLKTTTVSGEDYIKIGEIAESFLKNGISETSPKLVIFTGGVASGKTTIIKKDFSDGYVHFDYGATYTALKNIFGQDNPKLQSFVSIVCNMVLKESLEEKKNIVIEIIGDNEEILGTLIDGMKNIGYEVSLNAIYCDVDEALLRHRKAVEDDPDYLSSYFTQEATLLFFYQELKLGKMPSLSKE